MPDLASRARLFLTPVRADALMIGCLTACTLAFLLQSGLTGHQHWAASPVLVLCCAGLATYRRWPLLAAAFCTAGLAVLMPLGQALYFGDWISTPFLPVLFLFGYALGVRAGLLPGLAGSVMLTCGLWIVNESFLPVFLMMTFGPWLVGRVAASRRKLAEQLAARNTELAAEQDNFARESVRYERARIARELHDIVAHSLSIMVVQASAGQRARGTDQMIQALANVAQVAAQAQDEIGRLADLLAGEPPAGYGPSLTMVSELVRQATVTGLDVTCRIAGPCDELPPTVSMVAYRVVQESLTNALKHAPGAPVTVDISARDGDLAVQVTNEVAAGLPSSLRRSGGGNGLAGMRERVLACGGTLTAARTPAGGWQVSALLPSSSRPRHRFVSK